MTGATDAWDALKRELDCWAATGRQVELWWRDDDAVTVTPSLTRLLALSRRFDAPLGLAVIPQRADASLTALLGSETAPVRVLQHGFSHINHAPVTEKSQELGLHRPIIEIEGELSAGQARLKSLFGERVLPLLVPPWNRIDPALAARLPALGIKGLSTFGPRQAKWSAPGLLQVNCQLDPFAWKPARRFLGAASCLTDMVAELEARRAAPARAEEPLGLMTHHLYHDDALWGYLERLLSALYDHGTVRIINPAAAFQEAGLNSGFASSRAGGKA